MNSPDAEKSTPAATPKWRRFEHLVADVQGRLFPKAHVERDAHIRGKDSGELRQVDIAIMETVGQFPMLVAIDCKDIAVPVDVKDVESFIGLVRDIRANKGAIVSASGFTGTAKTIAENADIDLLRLVDTGEHEWKTAASIPVLVDIRSPRRYSLSFTLPPDRLSPVSFMTAPAGEVIPDDANFVRNAGELLKRRWNEGKLPDGPGVHQDVSFTDGPLWFCRGTQYREASVLATLQIEQRLRFGYLPLAEIRGFRNEGTGSVVTLGFRTGPLDVKDVETSWRQLTSRDELTITPVMELMMHDVVPLLNEENHLEETQGNSVERSESGREERGASPIPNPKRI